MSSSVSLGKNLLSLTAQRRLANTTSVVQSSLERLSSGLRINHASDDSAGLAVSSRLGADTRIYTQAIRNVNDSISVLNIADGTLGDSSNIIARLKELAEQSANGVYSLTQRKALDTEAKSLTDEFNRIINSAQFNSLKVLDGSLSNFVTQIANSPLALALGSKLKRYAGDGTFAASSDSRAAGVSTVATGDINGDGYIDSVSVDATTNSNGQIIVNINNGSGGFTQSTLTGVLDSLGNYTSVALKDINNDGKLDIVAGGDSSGGGSYSILQVDTFLGTGSGTFNFSTTTIPQYTGGGFGDGFSEVVHITSMTLGDLNGDGKSDLVYTARNTSTGADTVFTFLGDGSGGWGSEEHYDPNTSGYEYNATLADLNGDGRLDLVTGSNGYGTKVRLGGAGGTFGSQTSYGVGVYAAVGDINHDGILDIVSGGGAGAALKFYTGKGDGTFTLTSSQSLSTSVSALKLGDINNDGNVDIVTSDTALLGVGDGSFREKATLGATFSDFSLTDVNNDGVLDIVGVSSGSVYTKRGTANQVTTIERLDLTTQSSARSALSSLQTYEDRLSSERGIIGSSQSRLSSALSTLQSTCTNYAAAYSRIMDADIAAETAELTKNSILQNVTASLLGQANLIPQIALRLLS